MKRLACLLLLLMATEARAVNQLHGFYEAFARGTRGDETWQLDMPNHYFELRALATPWQRTEAFVEVSARSNRYRTVDPGVDPVTQIDLDDATVHRPEVLFNEGHISFRRDRSEVVIFSSQNRFWFSQPLLQVVDGNTLQDNNEGPRAQAVRVDFWELSGFSGLVYYGDKATNAEDFVAGRVNKSLRDGRIRLGTTGARKDFGDDTSSYDLVGAFDAEIALGELFDPISRIGRTTLVLEAGRNFSGWLSEEEDRRFGAAAELRDVRISALTIKGQAYYREPDFFTGVASRTDDDRRGYWVETWYRLPQKQINLRWAHWRSRAMELQGNDGERFDQRQHEVEAYAELKGGFSSWIKWRHFKGNRDPIGGATYPNLILEVQGQNKLLSVRPQVRFRDYGTRFATEGYGMDINLNVTSKWKFFGRFLNANENTESRRTFFVQARYNGWSDSEFFIEYGDGGRSDRLTENDGFVGEGPSAVDQDGERRVQLIMKMWF